MGLFDALLSQEGVNLTGGGFVGAPDDKLMETRFDDMGNAYQVDVRMPLHQGHTKANSFNIPDNAQGLLQPEMPTESIDLGRQQVVQPSPQMMQPVPQSSFMPGSQESMAQNQQSSISPWSPEQTDYTDARNVMSGYKGGERLAQRDSGTFQDLTPNADPSQAMEMLAMFKKEGKALTDLQFEKAMGSLGMSDVLAENRSQMNNVNESVNKLMNDNTNDFGQQVSADSFGQSDYDLNQQRQDTLDGLMMQDSNVANVAPQTTNPSWLNKNQDITKQSQDFVRNIPSNIAEGATSLFDGAKDLYSDFNKPDTRTQMEIWQDNSTSPREAVTDAWDTTKDFASDAYDSTMKAEYALRGGIKGVYDTVNKVGNDFYKKYIDSPLEERVQGADFQETLGVAGENISEDTARQMQALNQVVDHPVDFFKSLIDLASGATREYAVGGLLEQGLDSLDKKFPALAEFTKKTDAFLGFSTEEESREMATAMWKDLKEDFGSWEGYKEHVAQEPTQALLEVVGGGFLLRGVRNKLNDPALLDTVESMSRAIDPINLGPSSKIDDGVLGQTPTKTLYHTADELGKEALKYDDANKFVNTIHRRQSATNKNVSRSIAKDLDGEYSGNVEVPEGIASSIGDRGSRISVDGNDVYFNMSVEKDIGGNNVIFLPNIAVVGKNQGLGTKFMDAMKNFSDKTSQDIVIYKVTNDDFFRKFDWLEETELGGSFKYKAKKGNESLGLGQLDDIWKKAHKSNSVTDGLLGQTQVATDKITELQSEIKRLKGLRGKDVTQRTIDELRWAEEDLLKLNPLVAHHNMSSEALKKHSEYDGDIAMPSLGISKPDAPFGNTRDTTFGEIALLGDNSLIDPKKSNTFSSDAYTGRSPREMVEFDKDVEKTKDALGAETLKFHNRALYDKGLHEPEWLAVDLKTQELLEARGYNPEDYPSFLSMKRQATEDLGYKEVSYITVEATRNPVELGKMKRHILLDEGGKKEFSPKRALTEMRKQGGHQKGSEREIGDSDFLHESRARALTSKKYESLDELTSERNRVQNRSQYTHLEDKFSDMFDNTINNVEKVFKESFGDRMKPYKDGTKTYTSNLNRLDSLKVMQHILLDEKIPSSLNLSTSDMVKIQQKIKPMKKMGIEMPTAYFESKPNRIVNIGEFKTAIVPKGDTASIKRLEKMGIENIIEYKDQAGYLSAFKKNPELFFSKAIIPTSGLLGEDTINVEASEEEPVKDGILNNVKSWKPNNKLSQFVKMMENDPLRVGNTKVTEYDDVGHKAKGYGTKSGLLAQDTEAEASKALNSQLVKANKAVDRLVKIDLNEDQRNALVSLVYNIGATGFGKSNALKALNNGNIKTFLKEAFDPKIGFVKTKGKIVKGLVNRRAREKSIFTKGNYGN